MNKVLVGVIVTAFLIMLIVCVGAGIAEVRT